MKTEEERDNRFVLVLCIFVIISIFVGCVIINQQSQNPTIGGEENIHGCLMAGGYSWNETEMKCVREWETNESLRYQFPQTREPPKEATRDGTIIGALLI